MKLETIFSYVFLIAVTQADESYEHDQRPIKFRKRKIQQVIQVGGVCPTMIPPSVLAPDDSTCWQWWTPPSNGVVPTNINLPKGCDYQPCQDAVCACDSYCCDTAWDLSCRGYYSAQSDGSENNYFVDGCSAKILCCEQDSAYPDPPIGGAVGVSLTQTTITASNSGSMSGGSMSGETISGGSISGGSISGGSISGGSISGGSISGGIGAQLETSYQCTPGSPNCCPTMVPPSFLAPDDSTCWQWWDPPSNGILPPGTQASKGCNYQPCQDAVCACDSYCCDVAWDLSCRGYYSAQGDGSENNYFVDGCSAKILCCEQDSAYPDPPIGGAAAGITISKTEASLSGEMAEVTASKTVVGIAGVKLETSYQCTPGSPNCCPTMIPPSFLAPDDSTCWQWWDPPANGVVPAGTNLPKGCDYKPCQDAVCNCDNYCCDTAWDLSCRGYESAQGDSLENNYFVDGCSAKILCCEQGSAYPDPPIGGGKIVAGGISISKAEVEIIKQVAPAPVQSPVVIQVNVDQTSVSITGAKLETSYQCTPGSSSNCCSTMIPPSFLAPDDSTCWQWWDPPSNGVVPAGTKLPQGCDYKPCQDAVCACDNYCCDTVWDLSCRGYHLQPGDSIDNNYFVDGCSAKIICCEQESAYPDPPIGGGQIVAGAVPFATVAIIQQPVPVPVQPPPVQSPVVLQVNVDQNTLLVEKPVPPPVPVQVISAPVQPPVVLQVNVDKNTLLVQQPIPPPVSPPIAPPVTLNIQIANPILPPVVPPTFAQVVPPTFKPILPPTFKPVVPPTFAPVIPPTFKPVVPPTFKPVIAPTFKPVVALTFKPVAPPTFVPVFPPPVTVVSPVMLHVNVNQKPSPIRPPVPPPVAPPVPPPVPPPVAPPVSLNINVENQTNQMTTTQTTKTVTILCENSGKKGSNVGPCLSGSGKSKSGTYGGKKGATTAIVAGSTTNGQIQYVYGGKKSAVATVTAVRVPPAQGELNYVYASGKGAELKASKTTIVTGTTVGQAQHVIVGGKMGKRIR